MASISAREAAVYDRQIRLWGIDAQKRLQNSKVLICGASGLGLEVAKNLTLAGFAVAIQDHHNVAESDLGSNFFLGRDSVGKNKANAVLPNLQQLNPLVDTTAMETPLSEVDEKILTQFDCVLLVNAPLHEAVRINNICHKCGIKFFNGCTYGCLGTFFADLGIHSYPAKRSSGSASNASAMVTRSFSTLEQSIATPWTNLLKLRFGFPELYFGTQILEKYWETLSCHPRGRDGMDGAKVDFDELTQMADTVSKANGKDDKFAFASEKTLRLLLDTALSELSPVCAVLGGLIGQEITKAIAGKGQPICNSNGSNWLFFDPMGMIDKKGGAIVKSNPPKA